MIKTPAPINCLIVDDEPLALALLSDYVQKVSYLNLVQATSDPLIALNVINSSANIDLIFLDMQMPEINGLQFMKILQRRCMVIITTAYSEYALVGYEHHVVDYLLKPILFDRFWMATEKARERYNYQLADQGNNQAAGLEDVEYIFVKTEYRITKLHLNDILYLESARDYVVIHTAGDKVITLQTLKMLEEILPRNRFVRVHRSFIVSLSKVDYIEKAKIVINKESIPISDTYKETVFKSLRLSKNS